MILVSVGSSDFNRIIRIVDELKGDGRIKDDIVFQTGRATYKPKHAKRIFQFTSWDEINKLNKNAKCVIAHAGAGCILTALQYGTAFIAVPRLKDLGEHVNDHQKEIANTMEQAGRVLVANNKKEVMACIKKIEMGWKPKKAFHDSGLISHVEEYVNSL